MARIFASRVALAGALALALAGPLGAAGAADAPVAFVSAIEDLPLMAGLREAIEEVIVFDAPAGRIVEAYASGMVSRAEVLDFYAATLPQLGWVGGGGVFRREGEVLQLDFPETGGTALGRPGLTVRFMLLPAAAAGR